MRFKTKLKLFSVFLIILLAGAAAACIHWYQYVFAKTINGQIISLERVNTNDAILMGGGGTKIPASQLFSFAVAIRDSKGEIHTATSEDRQWGATITGRCVEATFFPYAPWELDKAGTFHGARLIRQYDCPPGFESPTPLPAPTPVMTLAAPVPTPKASESSAK